MAVGLSLAGVILFVFQNNLKERLLANLEPIWIAIQHGSKEQDQKLLPQFFLCSCFSMHASLLEGGCFHLMASHLIFSYQVHRFVYLFLLSINFFVTQFLRMSEHSCYKHSFSEKNAYLIYLAVGWKEPSFKIKCFTFLPYFWSPIIQNVCHGDTIPLAIAYNSACFPGVVWILAAVDEV